MSEKISTSAKPTHAPMTQFPTPNGVLHIGGIAIDQLAERIGQTPFYTYDRQLITERIKHLRQYLPKKLHIHYAIKANPMPALVQHLASLVDGFDIASSGEMTIALDASMPATNISFTGPGKTDHELSMAVAAGVTVNIESTNEMRRLARIGETLNIQPRATIRVNPDFELKTSGMKMGGGPKPFGIDAEQVPSALKELATLDIRFLGFHIFSGSQNLRADAIMEMHENTCKLAVQLASHTTSDIEMINIGGGFGIPYFPGEQRLNIEPIGDNLGRLLSNLHKDCPRAQIVTELGRYLVGEAGIYVCRIVDKKVSRGEIFLITDGGMHHHLAASGNMGQAVRKNYPVAIGTRMANQDVETVNIVGPLCTPLDILSHNMTLPKAEVGDLVVVYQSGAYGLSASPQGFLSHPSCAEELI